MHTAALLTLAQRRNTIDVHTLFSFLSFSFFPFDRRTHRNESTQHVPMPLGNTHAPYPLAQQLAALRHRLQIFFLSFFVFFRGVVDDGRWPEVFYELIHRDGSISCCFFFIFSSTSRLRVKKKKKEKRPRRARTRTQQLLHSIRSNTKEITQKGSRSIQRICYSQ